MRPKSPSGSGREVIVSFRLRKGEASDLARHMAESQVVGVRSLNQFARLIVQTYNETANRKPCEAQGVPSDN